MKDALGGQGGLVPMTTIEKDPSKWKEWWHGQGYGGKRAIDIVSMRDKLANARMDQWVMQYRADNNNERPDQEEYNNKYTELVEAANDEIYVLANRQRGAKSSAIPGSQGVANRVLWLDVDPKGKLYGGGQVPLGVAAMGGLVGLGMYAAGALDLSTAKQDKDRTLVSKLLSPFLVNMAGIEANVIDQEEGRATIVKPYNESHFLGWLDYLGDALSLATYASTAAVAGGAESPVGLVNPANYYRGWGSEDHLKRLARGENIVSLKDELDLSKLAGFSWIADGLASAGLISEDTRSTAEGLGSFSSAMGLALIDPDIFSLITFGAGKIGKAKAFGELGDLLKTSTKAKADAQGVAATKVADALEELAINGKAEDLAMGRVAAEKDAGVTLKQKYVADSVAKFTNSMHPLPSELTRAVSKGNLEGVTDFGAVRQDVRGARQALEASGKATDTKDVKKALKQSAKLKASKVAGEVKKGNLLEKDVKQYKKAQTNDLWANSVLADLMTTKAVVNRLRESSKVSRAGRSAKNISKELKVVTDKIASVRRGMLEAYAEASTAGKRPRTKKYIEAEKEYDSLMSQFNTLARTAAQVMDDAAIRRLDEMIANQRKLVDTSKVELEKLAKLISKRKAGFKPNLKQHSRLVKNLVRHAPKMLAERATIMALSRAYRDQAAAYTKLSNFIAKERPGGGMKRAIQDYRKAADEGADAVETGARSRDMAMIENVELHTSWFSKTQDRNQHIIARAFSGLVRSIRDFYDPAQAKWGAASKEVHQIGASLVGQNKKVNEDFDMFVIPTARKAGNTAYDEAIAAGKTLEEAAKEKEAAEVATWFSYMDSPKTVSGSVMNTLFEDRSLWEIALPLLRSEAFSTDPKSKPMLNVLVKMWMPTGIEPQEKQIAWLTNKATEFLREETKEGSGTLKNLTLEGFINKIEDLSRISTKEKPTGFGGVDTDRARVHGFAAKAITTAALFNNAATRINKLLGPDISEEAIEAAVRLSTGTSANPKADLEEALEVLNKLEVPINVRKQANKTNEILRMGLEMYTDVTGERKIMPTGWMSIASEALTKLEKECQKVNIGDASPVKDAFLATTQAAYRIWHTAILTGLFVPRIPYFANIYIGNFSQLLIQESPEAAFTYAKTSAKDLAWAALAGSEYAVGAGRRLWEPQSLAGQTPMGSFVDRVTEALAVKGREESLAPLTNALINQDVNRLMDPRLTPNSTKIEGATGETFTVGQLRKMCAEQNVFTSFSGGLADLLRRRNPGLPKTMWDSIQKGGPLAKAYADFANVLEQRQRAAFFTDLVVNKGVSPDEAGKRMRDALFDWDYPMTKPETLFASKIFMFWNFTRRAMGQAWRILFDPYTSGRDDTLAEGILRSSPALAGLSGKRAYASARLAAAERVRKGVHQGLTLEPGEVEEGDTGTASEYPWWAKHAGNKMFFPNVPMGAVRSDNYSQSLGGKNKYTHSVLTMPSFTPIEMANQWGDIFRILGSFGMLAAEAPINIISDKPSQRSVSKDVLDEIIKLAAKQGGPFSEPMLQTLLTEDKATYLKGGASVRRLSDRRLLEFFNSALGPFIDPFIWEDAKTGEMRATKAAYRAIRGIPGIANEFNMLVGPALDVSAEGGEWTEALLETVGSMLNFKKYRYSPEGVRDYDLKKIKDQIGMERREAERRLPWRGDGGGEEE